MEHLRYTARRSFWWPLIDRHLVLIRKILNSFRPIASLQLPRNLDTSSSYSQALVYARLAKLACIRVFLRSAYNELGSWLKLITKLINLDSLHGFSIRSISTHIEINISSRCRRIINIFPCCVFHLFIKFTNAKQNKTEINHPLGLFNGWSSGIYLFTGTAGGLLWSSDR